MSAVVGPVVSREGGYAFDVWTPEGGLARGFRYLRVEDACYARRFEIRLFARPPAASAVTCDTLDDFDRALAERLLQVEALPQAA